MPEWHKIFTEEENQCTCWSKRAAGWHGWLPQQLPSIVRATVSVVSVQVACMSAAVWSCAASVASVQVARVSVAVWNCRARGDVFSEGELVIRACPVSSTTAFSCSGRHGNEFSTQLVCSACDRTSAGVLTGDSFFRDSFTEAALLSAAGAGDSPTLHCC